MHIQRLALLATLALASPAAGQVVERARGVTLPPQAGRRLDVVARPDVPLLIGLNSGYAVRVEDMAGAGAQELADGFRDPTGTTTAPKLGLMAPQSRLIALVPAATPQARTLLPTPGWQPLSRLGQVNDFTFDATGRVMYGIVGAAHQVFRYDTQTEEIQFVGGPGTGPGQLTRPERIALDAQGRIYVADGNRIVRMNDITGNGWTAFGSHGGGVGQFNYIVGIAVDGKGRIYVSDFFNGRLVKMDDLTGAGWADYRNGIHRPGGVATDSYDRVYVALPVGGRIVRLDDISGAGRKELMIASAPGLTWNRHRGPATVVPVRPGRRDDRPR
jgi:sugar lactone lactonase YvrE